MNFCANRNKSNCWKNFSSFQNRLNLARKAIFLVFKCFQILTAISMRILFLKQKKKDLTIAVIHVWIMMGLVLNYRQVLYSHFCYLITAICGFKLSDFFNNKKFQKKFPTIGNVVNKIEAKNWVVLCRGRGPNNTKWVPEVILQTLGNFGYLLTPFSKQLDWEGRHRKEDLWL